MGDSALARERGALSQCGNDRRSLSTFRNACKGSADEDVDCRGAQLICQVGGVEEAARDLRPPGGIVDKPTLTGPQVATVGVDKSNAGAVCRHLGHQAACIVGLGPPRIQTGEPCGRSMADALDVGMLGEEHRDGGRPDHRELPACGGSSPRSTARHAGRAGAAQPRASGFLTTPAMQSTVYQERGEGKELPWPRRS